MTCKRDQCPCDACEKRCKVTHAEFICKDFERWFLRRWDKVRKGIKTPPAKKENSWAYYHPLEIERYLKHPPCERCLREDCNKPCQSYLDWYDTRMDVARKKAGL